MQSFTDVMLSREGTGIILLLGIILSAVFAWKLTSLLRQLRAIEQRQLKRDKNHAAQFECSEKKYPEPRVSTTSNGMFMVRGYPSTGKVMQKLVDGVEMEYLGLNRFRIADRSHIKDEEDEFCRKLLRLGANIWQNEAHYQSWAQDPERDGIMQHEIGYPSSGGMWLLKRKDLGEQDERLAMLRVCFTMDERCWVLKRLGAKFYRSIEECRKI
ncbi:uncharacterized protein PAC_15955 [Phialocephala subalpina]|uniref:Uncharacterized protein n=1 Tax=Phialocephala subalpina TaxID=576137 RepID=A0A1L7XM15_9HELO|nr:uncharacterized protein PAC_15955 [Phialocephala subalpina]